MTRTDNYSQDDKLTILATLFWVGAALLESDYEHEFLLGVRLLSRVMARLPLDRPDVRERLDRTQAHTSPSLHSLLLKVRINFRTVPTTQLGGFNYVLYISDISNFTVCKKTMDIT